MKNKILGLSVLALWCAELTAQEKDSVQIRQLDEVVVTDSRFQLKRENSGKTVIKITAEELERNQGRSVAEIINTKTGFELNGSRSNYGQNITAFVRGGNNRQVLVLIDGIQVSDPSNVNAEFDLRLLDASQIANIEIVKGAASTLYGNSAATAVISITTKKPEKEGVGVTLNSSLGTNQSQEDQDYSIVDFSNSAGFNFKKDNFTVYGSLANQNTDGLSAAIGEESDDFNRTNVNVGLGYKFSDAFDANLAFFYNEIRNEFDNGFPVEDANFSSKSEQLRYQMAAAYRYKDGSLNVNAAFNKIDRQFFSDFPSEFDSESITLDIFNKYVINEQWHTIIGLNVIDHKTQFTEEETATTIDPYLNLVYVSDFGLNLNTGARLNNHSEYGTNLVYNINPSYSFKVREGYFKLFGSYATSFIAPNLSQLFGPFGPNPDLEPEENVTFEAGFEYRPTQNFRFSALYFDRTEKNGIEFVLIDPDTFESQYQNVAPETNTYGFELELAARITQGLNFNANYAFTEKKEGLALRIPKNKVNAQVDYELNSKWLVSANYQFVSSREDVDFSTFESVQLNSYGLLGLNSRYRFSPKFSVFLAADNIFNTDYFEIFNFTTRGRNIRLGLNYKI